MAFGKKVVEFLQCIKKCLFWEEKLRISMFSSRVQRSTKPSNVRVESILGVINPSAAVLSHVNLMPEWCVYLLNGPCA